MVMDMEEPADQKEADPEEPHAAVKAVPSDTEEALEIMEKPGAVEVLEGHAGLGETLRKEDVEAKTGQGIDRLGVTTAEQLSTPENDNSDGLMEVETAERQDVTGEELRDRGGLQGIEMKESNSISITAVAGDISVSKSNASSSGILSCVTNKKEAEQGVIGSMEVDHVEVEAAGTGAEEQLNLEERDKDSHDVNEAGDAETEAVSSGYYFWPYQLSSQFSPKCLVKSADPEFQQLDKDKKAARYVKGCKWAPDGSCLISCADDDNLRLFNFPSSFSTVTDWTSEDPVTENQEWLSALKVKEGGLIYDYCWYPLMSSADPVSSCFLSTSSEAPIHLWDAFNGKLRATYTPYNHLDQVISAYSLAFDPSGQTIYSGFEKSIRVFNITRPGRQCTLRPLKQSLYELNQYGIISSIAVNPLMSTFYAVGSFDKSIGLYYEDGSVICLLQGHAGGITHMKFNSDGMKLFTGGRRDSRLICWDMRQMGEAYKIYDRVVSTHQRIYFDLDASNRYMVSGGTDGIVKVWDLLSEDLEPCCTFRSNSDCVNGVGLNPYIPLLATSSGQRHFFEVDDDSDDDELFVKSKASQERSCDIKLWKFT